ncbi:sigma factor-like helix-turn-helix DNA-binding protein [Sphingomonas sp. HF-S3]|uniref:Sigma factor-like helix-turn-helix DNA-binding protein n=1 Tax=Sphingomonas rustica TaxID=3103142 RepID=A0ABV0B7P3_9SPHN
MTEVCPEPAARLREALDALPWSERRVFELHAVDGLDYPAIAERLAISVAEVEQLLASALIRLGRHLSSDNR